MTDFDPVQMHAITMYQAAHDRKDVAAALAQFTHDARVIDDGRTYDGIAGVETFLRKAGSEYTYTRTLISAEEVASHCWRVTNRLEGNFPGGQVDLPHNSTSPVMQVTTLSPIQMSCETSVSTCTTPAQPI